MSITGESALGSVAFMTRRGVAWMQSIQDKGWMRERCERERQAAVQGPSPAVAVDRLMGSRMGRRGRGLEMGFARGLRCKRGGTAKPIRHASTTRPSGAIPRNEGECRWHAVKITEIDVYRIEALSSFGLYPNILILFILSRHSREQNGSERQSAPVIGDW